MKLLFLILLMLFPFTLLGQITFSKNYYEHTEINYMGNQENGYIITSYQNNDLKISRLNLSGDTIWAKKIIRSNFYTFPRVAPAAVSGNNLVYSQIVEGQKIYNKIVMMDKYGDTVWTRYMLLTNNERHIPGGVIRLSDGNFINFCYSSKLASDLLDVTVKMTKINTAGDILFEKSFQINYVHIIFFTPKIAAAYDNGYVISLYRGGIYRFNSAGELLWNLDIPSIDNISVTFQNKIISLRKQIVSVYNQFGLLEKEKTLNFSYKNIVQLNDKYYAIGKPQLIDVYDHNFVKVKTIEQREYNLTFIMQVANGLLIGGNSFASRTDENGEVSAIHIEAPLSNQLLSLYEPTSIHWYSANIDYVDIKFSSNGGETWSYLIRYFPSDGVYEWHPAVSSDSCMIIVSSCSNPDLCDTSGVFFIKPYNQYDYIAANEILMWIGNNGAGSHDPRTDGSGFYWPGGINNSGQSAIFNDGLVWGGKVNGEIRANGNVHRAGLLPGNILSNGTPANPLDPKFRVYKIKKNWEYLPPSPERDKYEYNFLNWPADLGAPWIDGNNDGIYTPGIDQPDYIGDEVLFYVANDLDTSTSRFTFGSNPVGLEFQTTVYAYERNDLKDVVFKKYKVINKSRETFSDVYFLYWVDGDMGDASDDWSAIDTILTFSYIYNGDSSDGIYGTPPPAVAHILLQSPIIPSTLNDSAYYNSQWIKGYKNISINSGGMLSKHAYYPFSVPANPPQGVYQGTLEFYNIMKGLINNGAVIRDPNTNAPVTYCVPGDPVSGTGWYHGAGWPGGPGPMDSYYHLTCGPFNMAPGDTQEVVYAIFMSQGSSNIQSIEELRKDAVYYRQQYYNNFPVAVDENNSLPPDEFLLYQNYPNPFNPSTKIRYSIPGNGKGETGKVLLKIYDVLGRELQTLVNREQSPGTYEIEFNGSTLSSGVYFYRLEAGDFVSTKKMILLK